MINQTGLADYLTNDLFKHWVRERAELELKWQKNLDGFSCVSTGFWKKGEATDWRSNSFVPAIKMKVITAWSLLVDVVLAGGRMPFNLKASPRMQVVYDDIPDDEKSSIEDAIQDISDTINQYLSDCKADRQLMRCVLSGAIYGEYYGKYFVHEISEKFFEKISMGGSEQYDRYEIIEPKHDGPAWGYVSNWNVFRDMETIDIQAGAGVCERQFISAYDLRSKKGKHLYIDDAITRAISEADRYGSQSISKMDVGGLPPGLRDIKNRKKNIQNIEFWCRVPKKIVEEFEKDLMQNNPDAGIDTILHSEDDGDEIEIMAETAGSEVIRYARNNSGRRPIFMGVWEENLDQNFGTGVADNLENSQKVLNGMKRAFEDNLRLSGDVLLAVKEELIGAFNEIKPGQKIPVDPSVKSVRDAIEQFVIQNVGAQYIEGLYLEERYVDEASMLPKILQGAVADKKAPDTAFELNQLQTNAGKYMGGVIRNLDEGLIEPVIESFYEYIMQDPEYQGRKGDFTVEACGFTSFQDRVVRRNSMMQFLQMALQSPEIAAETKLRGMIEEVAKSLDLDPDQLLKTIKAREREKEQEQQAAMDQQAKMDEMLELEKNLKTAQIEEITARADAAREKGVTERSKAVGEIINKRMQGAA